MITEFIVARVYQPVADFAAKRLGIICYRLGQQCAVASLVADGVYTVLTAGSLSSLPWRGLGTLFWALLMAFRWKEGDRLTSAMLAGKPALHNFGVASDLLFGVWMMMFGIDLTAAVTNRDFAHIVRAFVVPAYLSIHFFYMCRPMMPKPKREKIPHGVAQGAGA